MVSNEWYLEYQIHKNRPGLLGDIASLLGMLTINIITINGVENRRRGMLLATEDNQKIDELEKILQRIDDISITALRPPKFMDRMAVRHGRYPDQSVEDKRTYRFTRDELGLLVDFLAGLLKKEGHQCIGIRGMPRVGKTEAIIASSVCANKKWTFLSSTLLRQTMKSELNLDEMSDLNIYIIDGILSTTRASESHDVLVRETMRMGAAKVIEHPDIFVLNTEVTLDDFDYIIELRNDADEVITYDMLDIEFKNEE